MRKKIFTSRFQRFAISSYFLFFALFYVAFCFLLFLAVSKVSFEFSEKSYRNIVLGYSRLLTNRIDSYLADLDVIAQADIVKSGSDEDVFNWIAIHPELRKIYQVSLFFADKDGKCRNTFGDYRDISGRNYFKQIAGGKDYAVETGLISYTAHANSVMVVKRISYPDGSFRGVAGATISLMSISDEITASSFTDTGLITLMKDNGELLIHQDWKFLHRFNDGVGVDSEKKAMATIIQNKSGCIREASINGLKVFLAYEPVQKTDCIVTAEIPVGEVKKGQNLVLISLIAFCVLILILLFLEMAVFSHLSNSDRQIYDDLTGFYTREEFEIRGQKFLDEHKGSKFMFVSLDFRSFKFLNNVHSPRKMDMFLNYFAQQVRELCHPYTGIFSRGYADRFYAIFKIYSDEEALVLVADGIGKLERRLRDMEIMAHLKAGCSFSDLSESDFNFRTLNDEAIYAKNTIKDNLLHQFAVFTDDMRTQIEEERQIEAGMERALADEEFFVMYQPKISLKNDKIVGAEALIRWKNPELGILSPGKFIPIFEKNSFIVSVDFYLYERVFQFLRRELDAGRPVVPVSVNMSRNHTNPLNFVKHFKSLAEKYKVPSNLVEVEIIERTSFSGKVMLQEITRLLHESGFRVAMDDFGSGESSLNMLSSIPIDVIKFDQNFLSTNVNDKKNLGFIEKLVEMGKQLNMSVLFEGVETKEQIDFLKSIQCDEVQGFYYSKPLSEADFIDYIAGHI